MSDRKLFGVGVLASVKRMLNMFEVVGFHAINGSNYSP